MNSSDFQADIDAVARISAVPKILDVVCRTTGMGFSAVARVTEDRWICCSVKDDISFGLKPGGELVVKTTICNEIRASNEAVIIDHVAEDTKWCGHHTPAQYGFQSYISMPIIRGDGSFFGTLCAIDPNPAKLNTPEITEMFKLFAELIAMHLDAEDRLAKSDTELKTEKHTALLREQFIGVLAHDLRNPLAALDGGVQLLQRKQLDDKAANIVGLMGASVRRMLDLVNDVVDLARGRMAGGISVRRDTETPLQPALQQVIDEMAFAFPNLKIDADLNAAGSVFADNARMAQLFSNLLGNAQSHGTKDAAIQVTTKIENDNFILSVLNSGLRIPDDLRAKLFQPYFRRGTGTPGGLGLGLYISSEIARGHGGSIDVESSENETGFTVRIPVSQ
jgi:signal transduction histidine kinase